MSWLINDLETQNKPYYGQLASPHHPDNYIVATGWAVDNGPVQHHYFNSRAEADADDWLKVALATTTVYVAHNATFEIQWLMSRHREDFLNFIKRGGRIYCTQYARYLLSHQTETYPSLEDCSLMYGGTKKIDEVKLLWEQGVLTADIPKELLLRYLAGPDGDIENTRKVLFGTYAELVAKGMIEMFWERMDSLLFNAISTFNGLFIDLEVAQRNHKAQLERVAEIKAQINKLMPADMPAELEFNYGSDYHMSAFMFGGPVKYQKKVPYDPPKFVKGDFYKVDGKLIPVDNPNNEDLTWADRYQRGKQQGQLKVYREDTTEPKLKWADAIYEFDGLINLNTLPTHVQSEFLGKRATYRGKRYLCDREVKVCPIFGTEEVIKEGTPVYSTGKDALELLANFTEVAKPLKELASLEKDNGTYYITYIYNEDGTVKATKGMLQYVTPANIVHHSLNGTSTITGRLSSSNPNLQNLPRDGTSKVKEMFASRFGSAGRIVEVDYTALEVVTLAAISGDENLMAALLNNIDMHCQRLAGVLGEPYEEVYGKCHNKEHKDHKHYKQLRTDIKPRAFAAQYGASAHGISFATGCSVEEAQVFLEAEARLYPQTIAYRQVVRDEVERTGALAPPRREITDSGGFRAYRQGYFKAKGGTHYAFRTYEKRLDGQIVQDYKDTQLANYWCQGEASLIVQVACGRVIRWLVANDFFGGCVLPINTVHDAIYLDCINEEWAQYAGKMVQQIMETTPKYMVERMPAYAEWRYHTTPFPAAAECGPNMMVKSPIK